MTFKKKKTFAISSFFFKCVDLLIIFVISDSKWRVFGFYIVGWTREVIWRHHFGLWETVMGIFHKRISTSWHFSRLSRHADQSATKITVPHLLWTPWMCEENTALHLLQWKLLTGEEPPCFSFCSVTCECTGCMFMWVESDTIMWIVGVVAGFKCYGVDVLTVYLRA